MSNHENHITNFTPELHQQYLEGVLTPDMQHKVEKYLLDHPFEAEAMEGIALSGTHDFEKDVDELKSKLLFKEKETKIIPFWQQYWKIAAVITLLVVSTFSILEWSKDSIILSNKELALNDEKTTESIVEKNEEESLIEPDMNEILAEKSVQRTLINEQTDKLKHEARKNFPVRNKKIPQTTPIEVEEAREEDVFLAEEVEISDEELKGEAQKGKLASKEIQRKGRAYDLHDREVDVEQKLQPASSDISIAQPLNSIISGVETSKRMQNKLSSAKVNNKTIKGRVTSQKDGSPLSGVNVVVVGTTKGTITDFDGNYQLTIPEGKEIVSYSFIGYEREEVEIGNKTEINLALSDDMSALGEEIVTEYSASRRKKGNRKTKAIPVGGFDIYQDYLESSLRYPQEALDNNISGKVVVEFIINEKAERINFKIVKNLGYGCDEEAIRLIREGPEWQPASKRNKTVKEKVKVEIVFKE